MEGLTLEGLSGVVNKHLSECALQNQEVNTSLVALKAGHKEIKDSIRSFESNAWRALGAVLLCIVAAAIALMFQNLQFKQTVPTKQEINVDRYTQVDAARDRAAVEAQLQEILEAVKKEKR